MNTLVVRLDNAGEVLLSGPAVRAVAAGSERATVLAGPHGCCPASTRRSCGTTTAFVQGRRVYSVPVTPSHVIVRASPSSRVTTAAVCL